ncbi:MAG: LLM class flavin-dependent oxidoreductase, partial [Specibacter sp.]
MTTPTAPRPGFQPSGQIHFGVNLVGPADGLDFDQLRTLAQTAERGLFSLLTLDERYWRQGDPGTAAANDPAGSNDVATLLAALAAVTTNIGLVAAAVPDHNDPAYPAHRIASLDRISGGRAAWNLLPGNGDASGGERQAFMESAQRLWDQWAAAVQDPGTTPQAPIEQLGA